MNSKTDLIKFVMTTIEHNISDKEKAKEYLSAQGLNVDRVVSEGLKRIKKMQLQIEAERTRNEMISAEDMKQKANEWVEKLLANIDFSFPELVEKEKLAVNFRNMESLTTEDIKSILVKHFTLKFLANGTKSNDF